MANGGAHAALNTGVGLADGDVVMFINSDDYYVPGRVGSAVRALSGTADMQTAWDSRLLHLSTLPGSTQIPPTTGFRRIGTTCTTSPWVLGQRDPPWHNIVLTSGNLIIGRDLLARVGTFANLRLAHDWDMALRLLAVSDPVVIPDALYLYRFHGTNTFRGLDAAVADSESAHVHKNWADAISAAPMESSAGLPFVARLRGRRGLRASWDGA